MVVGTDAAGGACLWWGHLGGGWGVVGCGVVWRALRGCVVGRCGAVVLVYVVGLCCLWLHGRSRWVQVYSWVRAFCIDGRRRLLWWWILGASEYFRCLEGWRSGGRDYVICFSVQLFVLSSKPMAGRARRDQTLPWSAASRRQLPAVAGAKATGVPCLSSCRT